MPGRSYVLTVIVEKGKRSTRYEQEVDIARGKKLEILIQCIYNCRARNTPSRRLALASKCYSLSCIGLNSFHWRVFYVRNSTKHEIPSLQSSLTTASNRRGFVLKPYSLLEGESVVITLKVSSADGTTGHAQYSFQTNKGPSGGTCAVLPVSGVTLVTKFSFNCSGWFDLDEPLRYEFFYVEKNGKETVLHDGTSSFEAELPMGERERGSLLDVRVRVYDSLGTSTQVNTPVKVIKSKLFAVINAIELTSGKESRLNELLQSGDIRAASRLANNVLKAIKDPTNNTMEEQKQRAKIKSSIVLQMAAIKVQSADAIRDTSDVIAAATTSLDDIDIQAQKSSVEAFKSMASVLTDEAAQDVTYELLVQGAQGLVSSIGNVLRIASHSADISLLSVHNLTDTALNISQETGSNLKKAVEAKRVASELLTVFSRVGQTILSKQVIGEEPINFQGLSATLVLLREEPLMLAGKLLSNENASFQMPRETGVFGGETTYVDSQMLVTEHAVFTWDESASRVSTVVVGIETTDQHGNNITLLDLDTPVELMLPRLHSKGLMGNDTIYTLYSNRTMYHIINTQHSNMSLRVTVRPLNESRSLSIAVQRGTPPIFGRQDYMVTLARNATCSDASQAIPCADRYSFVVGPPLIASAGKYFVGVRLAEEHVGAVNYTMEAQASACIYWDKPRGEWVGDGCQIGPLSTTDLVHCLCSHLTSFSGQLIVLPNPIDFQKVSVEFKRLDETGNVVAFIALGVVFGVYVIVIAWARRQDHKDRMKVGLKPFIGSYCSSTFTYHTWVTTGIWRNAGTTANVFIVLNGEKQSSRPIHLRNPSCIPFARGNTDSFILSITEDLGRIKSVRIWHDNTGENPSWFLNHVIISTGESESRDLVFNFQQWLAVERGAGFVDRTKNVSSEEELSDLKASFGNRVYQELFQSHLWFSVLTRPPSCVFTRVQRVTCCLVLLLTMMLANAMFYELAPQADRNSDTTVKIGPLRLELRQLLIAIESAIIVAPLNFIIVFIFTHIKPRDRPNKSQRHYSVNRRRSLLKLTGPSEKKKCRFLLPYWFTYISYFLCLATVAASGTFIVFYSLMWGRYISTQWLISMVMAVTVDIFVSKPLSLILLVVFLVLLVRRKMDVAEYKDSQTTQGVILDLADVDLDENPDSLAQCAQYNGPCHVMPPKPPTKEQLEKSRRLHRMKQEMFAWVKEVVIFVGYLCILLVVAHGSRSQWMHPIKSSLFQTTADNDNMLTSFDKFWGWSSSVLLPILFEDGKGRVGQGTNEAYFGDGESIIVGTPTLRQIRVNRDHCEVVNIFRPYIHNCTSTLLTSEEETTASFLPGWKPKPINTTLPLILQKEKPWMYTNSELTGGTRFWSYIHARLVYSGGGYAVDLGKTKKEATSILKSLQENSWIDRYTAALFVDFAIYSPSTSLFGIVKIVMEMSPSGSIKLSHVIDIIRLYDVSTGYDVSLLFFQLLLPVLVIYFTMSLVLKLKKGILRFFCTVFNWVDMSQIVCVSAWMSVHIYKMIYIDKSSKALLAKTHATTGFDYIVMLNTIENVVIALVVFLNTLKLLIYCQFSHVKHFFQVLVKSFYDVGPFLTILFFAIGAFAQFAYIVFGQNLANHRNLLESYNCLLNIMIGADHDFRELTDFDAVIGSAYLMIFSFASMIFFVNFFILILIHYYDIGRKEQFAMYGLGMYIVDRFKEAMGVGKTVIPREPTEFDNIRQQCHLLRYMLKSRAFRQMEYRCEQILSKSVKAPQSPNGKVKTKCSLFKALAPLVHDRTTFDNPMLEERPPDKNSLFSGKLDRRLKTLSTLLNADYIDGFMEDLDVISLAEASAFWRRYHDSIIPASITQVFERPELPPELRSLVTDQISSEYATVSGFGIRKESLDYEPQRCEPDFTDSFTWEGPDTLPKVTFSDDTNGTEPLPASITEIFQNSHKNVQERSTRPIFAPVTEPRSKTPRRQSNALPLTLLRELDDGEEALPDSITDIFKTACKPTSTRTQSLPASEFTTLQQAKVSSWATFGKDAEATRNLPDTGILEDYHSFKKKGLVKTIRLRSTSVGEAQNMPKTTAGQLRPSRRHLKAPSTGKERKAYILPTVQEEFDKMKKEVSERGQRSPRNGNSG